MVFRRKLSRGQLVRFFSAQPSCLVAMEACASAHYWARTIGALGHTVKLIPPAYVKPFVKRQKNDAADAEGIAKAAARPTMRFVEPKSEAQQAAAMAYRTRDLLVRQRTQRINALRAHLAEYGGGGADRRRACRPPRRLRFSPPAALRIRPSNRSAATDADELNQNGTRTARAEKGQKKGRKWR